MELQFLGAATTVTGSQFLLTTSRAKVLIDCGMFQGISTASRATCAARSARSAASPRTPTSRSSRTGVGAFTKPRLRRVFIVHGDPAAQAALEPKIRTLGFDTHIPKWHERVTLD